MGAQDDIPVGGTTGHCHESSAAISEAARWYAANRDACERPVIPALRRRFGLTAHEAVTALREAKAGTGDDASQTGK
ncbi:hypothetical protein FY036_13445 [Mesorhizobium microcysteis]|uniref:Uncharacterized protein n=1 Tax=Neoaquamicrobium microcysteis TaxID=2682781 RepID=A0A5D4GVA9_9HYPH|nr:hypothetical protein FY036_13445 [Mesorhizobium microcysteis]